MGIFALLINFASNITYVLRHSREDENEKDRKLLKIF